MPMQFEINKDVLKQVYVDIGEKLQTAVNEAARETEHDDIDTAVRKLQSRLEGIGAPQDDAWCRNILTKLRAGEPVRIVLQ